MRTVGHRNELPIAFSASAELLAEGARFNEALQHFSHGRTGYIPKGVYFFKTHEEANRHQLDCLAAHMARIARERG